MIAKLAWLALLLAAAPAAPAPDSRATDSQPIPNDPAEVVRKLPHDPTAFTEGLFYRDGYFYESTGEVGHSAIRKVNVETGKAVRSVTIPPPYFGEGIVAFGKEMFSLTWQQQIGFRWSLDTFRKRGVFHYPGEGWALTTDGKFIIMSDGTASLRFLDPVTLIERRRLDVTAAGVPIDQLNELEYVDGEILANVWRTTNIARIDPATGHVVGWIDLSALAATIHATDPDVVPNGIAWDPAGRRLFVTGKDWPVMFVIKPPRRH